MPATLKIDNARYVITVDEQRHIIQGGSILLDGSQITRVGKAAELASVRADRVIDARHMVVTPGFFNGHMHISYAHCVRGIFPDDRGSPLEQVFGCHPGDRRLAVRSRGSGLPVEITAQAL